MSVSCSGSIKLLILSFLPCNDAKDEVIQCVTATATLHLDFKVRRAFP